MATFTRTAKSKRKMSKGLRRAAKVAMGAGAVYFAGKGLKQVSDAAESGDVVKLARGLMKLRGMQKMGTTGVQSVLDGLSGKGETDDDTEE